jgi:uncharacterized membrane protein YkvA (DUF1232 family)
MGISQNQSDAVKRQFDKNRKNMDSNDVSQAAGAGAKKLADLGSNIPSGLLDLWEDVKTMISMLGDFISGDYTEVPWGTITAVAGAVAYFACPIDAIPDIIPFLGFLDDAIVIGLCLEFTRSDLEDYRCWKASR